jgi:hypothetical protein
MKSRRIKRGGLRCTNGTNEVPPEGGFLGFGQKCPEGSNPVEEASMSSKFLSSMSSFTNNIFSKKTPVNPAVEYPEYSGYGSTPPGYPYGLPPPGYSGAGGRKYRRSKRKQNKRKSRR